MPVESAIRAAPLTQKILSQVAALARDLGPEELSLRLAAQGHLPVSLTVQHRAEFSITGSQEKGPLTPQLVARSSRAQMQAELQQWLEDTCREAGAWMDEWALRHGGEYRETLEPHQCMQQRPTLAVQEVCGTCNGRCQVVCPSCSGACRVQCSGCHGHGKVDCASCGGSRQKTCFSCGGSGTMEVRAIDATPEQLQQSATQYGAQMRQVSCSSCAGRGSNSCTACFDGTQTCSGCAGSGQVNCSRCGARGNVPCEACAATGAIHHTGRIHCHVSRSVSVDVSSTVAEDRQTLQSRVPFNSIGEFARDSGGVPLAGKHRAGHELTLSYTASIPLECAEANFAGHSLVIRAYGPDRAIYDYHNLVGKLLDADVAALEAGVAGNSLFGAQVSSSLSAATQRFLASEANALIAEAPAEQLSLGGLNHAGTPAAGKATITGVLKGALTMAPLRRRFHRAGWLFRLVMLFIAVQFIWSRTLLWNYLFVAFIASFFEWRHLKSAPAASTAHAASPAQSAAALQTLEAPIQTRLISAEYVRRASAAVSKAVPRLYGPVMLPWLYGIGAGVLAASFLARWFLPRWTQLEKEVVVLLLTGVAWLLAEMQARAKLQALLSPPLYARLKPLFRQSQNSFRIFPIAAVIVGWLLADFALRLYAHYRIGIPLY